MTKDEYTKRLEDLLGEYHIVKYENIDGYTRLGDSETDWYELYTSIKALIANQVREARIDELEHIVGDGEWSDDVCWYEKTRDEYTGTKYYSEVRHLSRADRIAQLRSTPNE